EGGEHESDLHLGQRNLFQELVGSDDRADVDAVDVRQEVHQAKQPKDDVRGPQNPRTHELSSAMETKSLDCDRHPLISLERNQGESRYDASARPTGRCIIASFRSEE